MAPTNEDPPADGQIVPKTTPEIFALSNIITVIVGEEKLTYALHESILRSRCPFFDKCLSSGMQEELEKTVRLPEERPSAFNILVQWMYTDRITTGWTDAGLVYSYALADKFCMTGLQNAIIDHVRAQQGYTDCKKRRVIMSPRLLETVWKHAEGSKLSQFVVDKLHYDVVTKTHHYTADTGGHFTEGFRRLAETCPQAANALLWKFIDSRQVQRQNGGKEDLRNPATLIGCVYHVHKEGEKCKAAV
ncbi:hypothetical protein EDD37DRAFT_176471 [Exophiala viscosa]|uniref:uncharacterized protein n=1 Tax=Exophiala viscosa TaxID=2486360 RepID=UPI002195625E|nr:hypothetical protein EDD37DRAFT_176471 [Exophiala viscosa]